MKRVSVVIVILACISLLLIACVSNTAPTSGPGEASSQSKIRIGVEGSLPPFEEFNPATKQLSGFDIDVMKAIAGRAGLEVEFVNAGKNQLLTDVLNCKYDAGISAVAITDELKQQLQFSDPYLTVAQALVVQKANISITGLDQLPGMTVGAQRGSSGAGEAQKIPGAQLMIYPSSDLAFRDLIIGNIDAVIAGKPRAIGYTAIPSNRLKTVGGPIGSESYGIVVCKKNPDLLTKINAGLAAVRTDGTLARLTRKWLPNW